MKVGYLCRALASIAILAFPGPIAGADGPASPLRQALDRAGENRPEIERALAEVSPGHRSGMEFLVIHMPERDLTSLRAGYLLDNVRLAYEAWEGAPWKDALPEEIFLNDVLPYAVVNERRDGWREDFRGRFLPLVTNARTPGEAAAILNREIYPILGVEYSTERSKPDQSPYEAIEEGKSSCTGLSVLLVDACRSVGVPARFAGIPVWPDDDGGNHSWVEIWDEGWHFTGAAEPTSDHLDDAWFVERAAKARRDEPEHAIYAVSYARTPIAFPLVWDDEIDYVHAVNVTDRYTARGVSGGGDGSEGGDGE